MRKLLPSLLLLFCFNNLRGQEYAGFLLENGLSPKETNVQVLLHEHFAPDRFIQASNLHHQETWMYNENKNGRTDSTLIETIDYQYNNLGQIVQEESNNKLNFSTYKYLYSYNAQGMPEKRLEYAYFHKKLPLKDYISITEFAYNNFGDMTLNFSYGADSVFEYSQKRQYDAHSNILKIARNTANKFLYTSHDFHYNKEGELEKVDFLSPENRINYSCTLKLDTADDKKTITVFRDNKLFRTYKYNNIQQCVQIVTYEYKGDDPLNFLTKIIYNPNGTVNTELFYLNSELQTVHKVFYK